jgi:xylulokinase
LVVRPKNSLMNVPLLVGLDAGTSATKACAFTTRGRLVAEVGVPVALEHPSPGFAEQPAGVLAESACEALRLLARQIEPRAVAGIGVTGQMGGLVLVDPDGRAISPHLSWLDGRAGAAVESAMEEHGRRILELGGLSPYLAPKAAWWLRAHSDAAAAPARMVEPAGFILLQLAGAGAEDAVIDRSSCGFAGLFDVRSGDVEPELAALWGVSADVAPRVAAAGEVAGSLSASAASATGLPAGIPLVVAPGDGPCGWLGVGAVESGVTVDTAGTSDHVGICTTGYTPDAEGRVLICLASGIEGLWHLQGYTSGTGLTQRWFLETFPSDDGFAGLEREAATVPAGAEGLVCIPHFGGRVCPYQPAVAGVFVGLTWRHRRENLYRALLESVAYEYGCYLEAARRLDPRLTSHEVRLIGGGAASGLWTQIKADVLGIPYSVMEESNYTCWGAAISAGVGVGVLDDMASVARETAKVSEVIEPDPAAAESYGRLFNVYKSLYEGLEGPFRSLWLLRQESSQRAGL